MFVTATGFRPHDYQTRLACGERRHRCYDEWLIDGSPCESMMIEIPTGFGKTAAVVLAWLWNRVVHRRDDWPRRLVYCLPMRTLVEQTNRCMLNWLSNLGFEREVGLHVLMGGEDPGEWDVHPERNALLVGTQDMLLSRALNRGYGMSRYRWPMHFGLLNNDCLWIMDEVQLMGPGLWTSAQLDWMRTNRFKSLKRCSTWWMSATIRPQFLATRDRTNAGLSELTRVTVGDDDRQHELLRARRPCELWKLPGPIRGRRRKASPGEETARFIPALAAAVATEHEEASLSLVVCNTVSVAQRLYEAIRDIYAGASDVILLTSRFRSMDRQAHQGRLLGFEVARQRLKNDEARGVPGVICVSTQLVEAGVDVSARRLWSEVAPWPSVIQRLGRLNRDGRLNGIARAWFWESPTRPKRGALFIGPYEAAAVELGRKLVCRLIEVCKCDETLSAKEALTRLSAEEEAKDLVEQALTPAPQPCPRALDVHGLFSTEPDVFGGFTDVSPYVRNQDENADVTVFWREWGAGTRLGRSEELSGPAFARDEGCSVAVGRLREFLDGKCAWRWDDKLEAWERVHAREIRPGMVVMLRRDDGCYSRELGWTGRKSDKLDETPPPGEPHERFEDDRYSENGGWVTLSDHLKDTEGEAVRIVEGINLDDGIASAVVYAASEHDIGKALPEWQDQLPQPRPQHGGMWAKAPYQLAVVANPATEVSSAIESILRESSVRHRRIAEQRNNGQMKFVWHTGSKITRVGLDRILAVPGTVRAWSVPFRPGLRHEAATALALWHSYYRQANKHFAALSIYLSAAHHGKVRTVLTSRTEAGEDVCGVLKSRIALPWNEMQLDFACTVDGASGRFSEDGSAFILDTPGWTGLVADLLGAWEADAVPGVSGAVPDGEPRDLGPFALAYLETLVRCADERASKRPSTKREVDS